MSIVLVKSNNLPLDCERPGQHARPRERAGGAFLEFDAKEDEWEYWKNLAPKLKEQINQTHLVTGRCVLCMLDEHLLMVV